MDISVIVPIYGVEEYIERCLRSLFTQTKTDGVEFILVNDCTKDNSMEIARKVISEFPTLTISIIEHSQNMNVAATRQTGLDAAIGEYIIQIDSDDWCELTMLEDMYCKAIEIDADIVYCDYFVNKIKETLLYSANLNISNCKLICSLPPILPFCGVWNKLIRRSIYVKNKIDINVGINHGEDTLWFIKVLYYAGKVFYLPKAYYHYSKENINSITRTHSMLDDELKSRIMVEEFLANKGILNSYKEEIIRVKAYTKIFYFRILRKKFQCKYLNLYGNEVDNYILNSELVLWRTKVPYFLIINRFFFLGNLIYSLYDIYWLVLRICKYSYNYMLKIR